MWDGLSRKLSRIAYQLRVITIKKVEGKGSNGTLCFREVFHYSSLTQFTYSVCTFIHHSHWLWYRVTVSFLVVVTWSINSEPKFLVLYHKKARNLFPFLLCPIIPELCYSILQVTTSFGNILVL